MYNKEMVDAAVEKWKGYTKQSLALVVVNYSHENDIKTCAEYEVRYSNDVEVNGFCVKAIDNIL